MIDYNSEKWSTNDRRLIAGWSPVDRRLCLSWPAEKRLGSNRYGKTGSLSRNDLRLKTIEDRWSIVQNRPLSAYFQYDINHDTHAKKLPADWCLLIDACCLMLADCWLLIAVCLFLFAVCSLLHDRRRTTTGIGSRRPTSIGLYLQYDINHHPHAKKPPANYCLPITACCLLHDGRRTTAGQSTRSQQSLRSCCWYAPLMPL